MKEKMANNQKEKTLPRAEKQCHIIVSEEMHNALKFYALRERISVFAATSKLLQIGFSAEMNRENAVINNDITKLKAHIEKLAKQSIKNKKSS